jgi:acetyl-CoA acetyltransferase
LDLILPGIMFQIRAKVCQMDCTETPLLNLMEPPVSLLDIGPGKIQADKETQAAALRVSERPPGKCRSRIVGCGSYLPHRKVSNNDLARRFDTSDEWIGQRTGIRSRHIAAPEENTSDLALAAARKALDHAGLSVDTIDLIVLATATPDHIFPATATKVQAGLGMTRGVAFDVQAVCAGFIFALSVADNFIRLGQAQTALVIGAETFSRILDWEDRTPACCSATAPGRSCCKPPKGKATAAIVASCPLISIPTDGNTTCCSSMAVRRRHRARATSA